MCEKIMLIVQIIKIVFRQPSETRSGTRPLPAGRPEFERDDDFPQRVGKNFIGTAIFSGRSAKNSAGRVVAEVLAANTCKV